MPDHAEVQKISDEIMEKEGEIIVLESKQRKLNRDLGRVQPGMMNWMTRTNISRAIGQIQQRIDKLTTDIAVLEVSLELLYF